MPLRLPRLIYSLPYKLYRFINLVSNQFIKNKLTKKLFFFCEGWSESVSKSLKKTFLKCSFDQNKNTFFTAKESTVHIFCKHLEEKNKTKNKHFALYKCIRKRVSNWHRSSERKDD